MYGPAATPVESAEEERRRRILRLGEFLADLLDRSIRIPGTDYRIGLDPLIGLIPGIGDVIAAVMGVVIVWLAARAGVPRITLTRMGMNVLTNGLIGIVPGLSDLFSAWFKSNVRNVEVMRRVAARSSTAPDWMWVVGVSAAILAVLISAVVGMVWLVSAIWPS